MFGPLMLIFVALILVAWFLIVERQNVAEKIFIILTVAVLFAAYRVLAGTPTDQIFTPIINFFNK